MNRLSRSRLSNAALAAAFVLLTAAAAACTGNTASSGNSATNPAPGPTTAPVPAANANTAPAVQTPPAPGQTKPPLGMEDQIEGRVIGLVCYKQNPKASAEELKACSTANVDKGGALGVLASDGTLYVDAHPDARVTNAKLKYFIGEDVTVQGQTIGDAPNLDFGNTKVVKFDMKLARRKGDVPAGAKPDMPVPKKPGTPAPAKKG